MRGRHTGVTPQIRAWRSAALVLVGACGLSFFSLVAPGGAAPAFAGCEARSIAQMRAEADATAAGTIVAIERPGLPFGLGTPQGATYWFEITHVYDGDVHQLIEVDSLHGYDLDQPAEGRGYLLFLRGESPRFSSDGCASMPMPLMDRAAAATLAQWEWTAPESGGADLPRSGIPWMPIGFGVIVAGMVLLLVRDGRRTRKHPASHDTIET